MTPPRTLIATGLTAAALLAVPAAAPARPDLPRETTPPAPVPAAAPATGSFTVTHDGGADTITVLVIAGGTLLAGAAGGFGGGRVLTRRHAVRP